MLLAIDVGYEADGAIAAGVLFEDWADEIPQQELTLAIATVADYEPGHFYKRELPCILSLLEQLPSLPSHIIIDGFVCLGADRRPGLGYYLHEALKGQVIVIGVAKTRFHETPIEAELLRGTSQRPLYVTAIGIELDEAIAHIAAMTGPNRVPLLLKRVDQLSRGMGNKET
jgi:deoxyribonuclease V